MRLLNSACLFLAILFHTTPKAGSRMMNGYGHHSFHHSFDSSNYDSFWWDRNYRSSPNPGTGTRNTGSSQNSGCEARNTGSKLCRNDPVTTKMETTISKLEGTSEAGNLKIPTPVWVQTPSVTQISENVYDVLGREVYMSTVLDMFEKDPNIKFPVFSSEDPNMKLEFNIRGDTIYLDRKTIKLNGLKKLTIYCRRLIAADTTTISLDAPITCGPTTTGKKCDGIIPQATDDKDGLNGKPGSDTPLTNIYAHQINGNIEFTFKASDGNRGQDGSDGSDGEDITYEPPALSVNTCPERCSEISMFRNRKKSFKGKQGYTGGDGKDGRHGGDGGAGGHVSNISLSFSQLHGLITIKQTPGLGGRAGCHGRGGKGGNGGKGGCGVECKKDENCSWGRVMKCRRYCKATNKDTCVARGDYGNDGYNGCDGSAFFSRNGKNGTNTSPNFGKVDSLREAFADEEDLLKLIKRYSESMFQRNQNTIAEEILFFLLSVTHPNTSLYNEISNRLGMIRSGFDYYGNTDKYAPDFDWSYLSDRTDDLLEAGGSFEDAYNSIKDNIHEVSATAGVIQKVAKISIKKEDRELENNEKELKSRKNLYYKSLRHHEQTITNQQYELKRLLSKAVNEHELKESVSITDMIKLISGIAGMVAKGLARDVGGAVTSAIQTAQSIRAMVEKKNARCKGPTIEKASKNLEEKLKFAYEYEKVEPEDLDFSAFDVSMVSEIVKSNLAKNKANLIIELKCFLDIKSIKTAEQLTMVLDNFFRDADLRISLIDKLINCDILLKEISNNRKLLKETNEALDAVSQSERDSVSVSMEVKKSFADLLFSMYQQQENSIMRSIYELSKAYQFASLWNFSVLGKYNNRFSDQVMISNLGALVGIQHLDNIRQSLEDERNLFLNMIKSAAGPSSHIYVLSKEFSQTNSPDIISDLQNSGSFTIRINLDPDDIQTTGCHNCYNQRLESFYVELIGDKQNPHVPAKLYIQVAHMGDSYFLVPTKNGGKEVILLQQSPENIEGGHIMTFDSENLVSSAEDLELLANFDKEDHQFCEDSDDFFTQTPCKSPYSTFAVTIPRSSNYECTLNPNNMISGLNCKDLDFNRFTSVRIYAKIKSWSHYPSRPDNEADCETYEFKVSKTKGTFDEVRTECIELGGDLFQKNFGPAGTKYHKKIEALVSEHDLILWIGYTDREKEGTWRFLDGEIYDAHDTNLGGFSNWATGEPNNYSGNQHCAKLYRNLALDDSNCDTHYHGLCEIKTSSCRV